MFNEQTINETNKAVKKIIANLSMLSFIKTVNDHPNIETLMVQKADEIEQTFLKHFHQEMSIYEVVPTLLALVNFTDEDMVDSLHNMMESVEHNGGLLKETFVDGRLTLNGIELIQMATIKLGEHVDKFMSIVQESADPNYVSMVSTPMMQ